MKTPGGPSARTMDVLNSATDILNEINKLRIPLPQWDWSPEIDWYPGDPIYTEPVTIRMPWGSTWRQIPASRTEEGHLTGGQHTRPMIQEFDLEEDFEIDEHLMQCATCEVSGSWEDRFCWNCDEELSRITVPDPWGSWITPLSVQRYTYDNSGDVVEGASGVMSFSEYARANLVENDAFETGTTWRGLTEVGEIAPWQARYLQDYAERDVEFTRQYMFSARRHGHSILQSIFDEWFVSPPAREPARPGYHWYEHDGVWLELPDEIPTQPQHIPTSVEIHNSRTRSTVPQRTYPTSRNPTQERRRRNH